MPSLGIGLSGEKQKNRTPNVVAQEDFDTATRGYTGENANVALYSTGLDNPCLQVDCTATTGYAYKEYTVLPSTRYYFRIRLAVGELGSGNKTVKLGTSAGDDTHFSGVQNVPGVTTWYHFTTGGSQTSVFVSLQQQISGKFAGWDDFRLETWDG